MRRPLCTIPSLRGLWAEDRRKGLEPRRSLRPELFLKFCQGRNAGSQPSLLRCWITVKTLHNSSSLRNPNTWSQKSQGETFLSAIPPNTVKQSEEVRRAYSYREDGGSVDNLGVSLHSPVLYSPVSRILNTTQVVHYCGSAVLGISYSWPNPVWIAC